MDGLTQEPPMPDPQNATVSATQSPMLLNASPYGTKWMLWQKFANGMAMRVEENERMRWGTLMQPLVLSEASYALKLEVSASDEYVRRGSLGCTRDAVVYCPDRGPGALTDAYDRRHMTLSELEESSADSGE